MTDFEGMVERFYTRLLRPGDHSVDVGAHRGRHAIPIARAAGPTGYVDAFEPLPDINRELHRIVAEARKTAPLAPIEIHACALGEAVALAEFVAVDGLPEYSGLRERIYDQVVRTTRIRVVVERLDDYLAKSARIRYVKIDAEGGEFPILRGAERLVERDRPAFTFECGDNGLVNYPHRSGDIHDWFAARNYALYDIHERPLDRAAFERSCADQHVWDYIALPRGESLPA